MRGGRARHSAASRLLGRLERQSAGRAAGFRRGNRPLSSNRRRNCGRRRRSCRSRRSAAEAQNRAPSAQAPPRNATTMRVLSPAACPAHKRAVPELFDMELRAIRRDRAARPGPSYSFMNAHSPIASSAFPTASHFQHALLIGCPDRAGPSGSFRRQMSDCSRSGPLFASGFNGQIIVEDMGATRAAYDLVLAVGTLDTQRPAAGASPDPPLGCTMTRLLIGALSGGDTLPAAALRDACGGLATGAAAPHVHPRIEASALAPLLGDAGFLGRWSISIGCRFPILRSTGWLATFVQWARPMRCSPGRASSAGKCRAAAIACVSSAGDGSRTVETFEILHFAAWTSGGRLRGPLTVSLGKSC